MVCVVTHLVAAESEPGMRSWGKSVRVLLVTAQQGWPPRGDGTAGMAGVRLSVGSCKGSTSQWLHPEATEVEHISGPFSSCLLLGDWQVFFHVGFYRPRCLPSVAPWDLGDSVGASLWVGSAVALTLAVLFLLV